MMDHASHTLVDGERKNPGLGVTEPAGWNEDNPSRL
jgi:hypothetical protein